MKLVKISKYSQLLEYNNKLTEVDYLSKIHFDTSNLETIQIHVKSGGKYDPFMSTTFMEAFLCLQVELYKSYAEFKYRKRDIRSLKKEEKEALKIIVKVSKGSSIFSIILPELVEPLMESISNTTQIELFRNQALIISAKVIVSFFSKWLDSKITLSDKQNKDNKQFSYKRKNSK